MILQTHYIERIGYIAVNNDEIGDNDVWYDGTQIRTRFAGQIIDNYDKKIVATDASFKLEGIPQFELISQFKSAKDEYIKLLEDELTEVVGIAAIHGWKSNKFEKGQELRAKIAQEKGCYSEEDLSKALKMARLQSLVGTQLSDGLEFDYSDNEIVQFLKQPKKLVSIEVEYEYVGRPYNWEDGKVYDKIFKVTNGLLTVTKYNYENK